RPTEQDLFPYTTLFRSCRRSPSTTAACSPGCGPPSADADPLAATVFYLDDIPEPGQIAVLDGPEGRHAATVRRTRVGEAITLSRSEEHTSELQSRENLV